MLPRIWTLLLLVTSPFSLLNIYFYTLFFLIFRPGIRCCQILKGTEHGGIGIIGMPL